MAYDRFHHRMGAKKQIKAGRFYNKIIIDAHITIRIWCALIDTLNVMEESLSCNI